MKPHKLFAIIAISLFFNSSFGQSIVGYSFEDYKIIEHPIVKKAKINYSSNPEAKMFRTRISEGYNSGKISFAGYYITMIWGCGTGCITGMMVDVRDGKVYNMPIDEYTAYSGCYSNDEAEDDERLNYQPNSRLLITMSCSEGEIENTNNLKQEKTYYINIWDDVKKKFISKKQIKKNVIKKKRDD